MKKNTITAPLTFDLPLSLIKKIEIQQKKSGLNSASEVVRAAIVHFNIDRFAAKAELHRQISVRLPADLKLKLARAAKRKKMSVGGLLRMAIDAYDAKLSSKTKR